LCGVSYSLWITLFNSKNVNRTKVAHYYQHCVADNKYEKENWRLALVFILCWLVILREIYAKLGKLQHWVDNTVTIPSIKWCKSQRGYLYRFTDSGAFQRPHQLDEIHGDEKAAWESFKCVCLPFLRKNIVPNYKELGFAAVMPWRLGCNMSENSVPSRPPWLLLWE
jgi:hypothetical protein